MGLNLAGEGQGLLAEGQLQPVSCLFPVGRGQRPCRLLGLLAGGVRGRGIGFRGVQGSAGLIAAFTQGTRRGEARLPASAPGWEA